jgi:autotransporter-associated beta strand protein
MTHLRRTWISTLVSLALARTATADSIWFGGSGLNANPMNWSESTNWINGIPDSTTVADFNGTGLMTVNVDTNESVGGLSFSGQTGYSIQNNTLTIGSSGISAASPSIGSVTHSVSSSVVFNTSNAPVSVASNATVSLSGASISGTALTLSGAGTLTLSGSSTFTNGATINGGTLQIGNGFSGNITNNSAVSFNSSSTLTYSNVIGGTGSLTKAGSGTLILTNSNSYTGSTTVSGGTLQLGNGGTTGWISGNITNNSTLAFNRSDTVTYSGTIGGSGSLIQSGPGTLILAGNQTFTGNTTISSGTLQIGNGGSTGSLTGNLVNNSVLVFNRTATGSSYDYSGNISGTGTLIQAGNQTVRLGGSNTFTGGITINSGVLTIGTAGTTGSIVCNVVDNSIMIFNRTSDYAYSGNISGFGSIYKVNGNTLTLTGTNTYAGTTNLEGGKVNFTSLSNLGTSGTIRISGGGLQWATGNTTDISGRPIFIDAGGATFDTNGNNVTIANSIGLNGSGSLTKSGLGTLTLSGSSAYTGSTSVNAGTLLVSGSLSATASASIAAGATMRVDGSITRSASISVSGTLCGSGSVGSVSVFNGGTLVAGNGTSPGFLKLSGTSAQSTALSGTTGATLSIQLGKTSAGTPVAGSDYSQLSIAQGSISLNNMTLSLAGNTTNVKGGDLFFIILNGSNNSTGTFNGLADQSTFAFNGQSFEISYFANHLTNTFATGGAFNDIAIMAVPEPGSCVLLVSAGLCIIAFHRSTAARKRC